MKITLVTGNKAKAGEVKRILNIPLQVSSIELDEIQEIDLEKVALHKINQAFQIVKKPVIVDDKKDEKSVTDAEGEGNGKSKSKSKNEKDEEESDIPF